MNEYQKKIKQLTKRVSNLKRAPVRVHQTNTRNINERRYKSKPIFFSNLPNTNIIYPKVVEEELTPVGHLIGIQLDNWRIWKYNPTTSVVDEIEHDLPSNNISVPDLGSYISRTTYAHWITVITDDENYYDLYRSTNNGLNWTISEENIKTGIYPVTGIEKNIWTVKITELDEEQLLTIINSTDNGLTWEEKDEISSLPDSFRFYQFGTGISINPSDEDQVAILFVRDGTLVHVVHYTLDGGNTWNDIEIPEFNWDVTWITHGISILEDGSVLVVGQTDGSPDIPAIVWVAKAPNLGASFTLNLLSNFDSGIDGTPFNGHFMFDSNSEKGVVTYNYGSGLGEFIFHSVNGGESWNSNQFANPIDPFYLNNTFYHPESESISLTAFSADDNTINLWRGNFGELPTKILQLDIGLPPYGPTIA